MALSHEILKTLGHIDDASTELLGVMGPLLKRHGVESVITRSPEERIELLAKFFKDAKEIRAAVGGDDGDLDEIAEALIRAGVVPPPGVKVVHVRVTSIPEGPAPDNVRQAWVGVELRGLMFDELGNEKDFVSGAIIPDRGEVFAVAADYAIEKLREGSPAAGTWFQTHFPKWTPALTFKRSELEVISP